MEEKKITWQQSTIVYRVTGSGKPVVLLHGFGEDGNIWQHQIEFLQNRYCLIIPNLPGSGKSEMIADMSIEGMADCIKAVIDHEKLNSVVMLGHSMGGYITLAIAEKYPQLFRAFGLVHSSAYADSEEKKAARQKSIEFIETYGAYEFLKTAIPGLFLQPINNKTCDGLITEGKNFTPEALAAYYIAMINRPDRAGLLQSFPRPILFVMGEHDKAVPFAQSLQQCRLPQQCHIHILRHSAHMGMWEEPEKTNAALKAFLSAQFC